MGKNNTIWSDKVFVYTGNNQRVPTNVVNVRFHSSVIKVKQTKYGAFHGYKLLKNVVLNEGLTTIEKRTFGHCTSLKSIKLPSTVTEIGNGVFKDCTKLQEVVFNKGLQKIGRYAFGGCKSLQSITFPSTVNEIGPGAFDKCSELRDVVFNEGLIKIEENTFNMCTSLESITLPPTVTDIGYGAFRNCSSLREVVLNEGLTEIGSYAFDCCRSLVSINLPSTIYELGNDPFSHCSKLKEMALHEEIKYRSEWTSKMPFESFSSTMCLHILGMSKEVVAEAPVNLAIHGTPDDSSISSFGSSVDKFDDTSSSSSSSSSSISFGYSSMDEHASDAESIEYIGKGASDVVFEYTGQRVPRDVVNVRFHPGVVKVENNAFSFCSHLREVILNEGLKEIGSGAFKECPSLRSISFPSTLISIQPCAFGACSKLKEVVLNEGLQKIHINAFTSCSLLESLTLSSTITYIDRSTFNRCSNLRDVVLNENIKSLDTAAFTECPVRKLIFRSLSTRLNNIIHADQTEAKTKINDIRGAVEWNGTEMFVFAPMRIVSRIGYEARLLNWKEVRASLDKIVKLITYYEVKEAATLLELALWKTNMNQAEEVIYARDRDGYRVDVPGPVKDAILQYMHGVNIPLPSSHIEMADDFSEEKLSAKERLLVSTASKQLASARKELASQRRHLLQMEEELSSQVLRDWHSDNDLNHPPGSSNPTRRLDNTTSCGGGGRQVLPGSGQQQPVPQQFLSSGLNGDWHSENDLNHRREMIQHIKKLLKQKDNNASSTKFPQMIKQLEVSLYRSASSLKAYSDTTTLKMRLQQLAMEIAKKAQQAKEGRPGSSDGQGSSCSNGQSSRRSSAKENDGVTSSSNSNDAVRHKQQRLLLLHHSSKCTNEDGKCTVTPYCGEMKKLWNMASCTDNECRVPHCLSSRSILRHHRKCKDPRCLACGPARETIRKTQNSQKGRGGNESGGGGGSNGNNGVTQDPVLSMPQDQSMDMMQQGNPDAMPGNGMMAPPQSQMSNMGPPQQMGGPMMNGMPRIQNNMFSLGQNMPIPPQQQQQQSRRSINGNAETPSNDTDAKSRHKRQRLLLLRHASKCTAENGTCSITPHCAEMKVLWKHIAECKDQKCLVPHCVSSRYVLSHYRRCKPPCNICDPVKEIIKNGEVDPVITGNGPTSLGQRTTPPIDDTMQQPRNKRQKEGEIEQYQLQFFRG